MTYINYDTNYYNFREIVTNLLGLNDLEKMHNVENYDLFKKGTDQSTKWHKLFYNNLDKITPLYEEFIYEVIKPIFGEEIVLSKNTNI
jgi:hypothetical protein